MIYFICGLIGSGKTTYAKANFENVTDWDEIGSKQAQIDLTWKYHTEGKEKEVRKLEPYIVGGLVGFSIGLFVQRWIIICAVDKANPDVCDYCKWLSNKKNYVERKTSRHGK